MPKCGSTEFVHHRPIILLNYSLTIDNIKSLLHVPQLSTMNRSIFNIDYHNIILYVIFKLNKYEQKVHGSCL